MLIKGLEKGAKADWQVLEHTKKKLQNNDIYVLGDPSVRMPGIVSSSSKKGVKARLVCAKSTKLKGPPTAGDRAIEVLKEWAFTADNQSKPLRFEAPMTIDKTFWVEMINPHAEDVVVNALIHGVIRSKAV